jgi:uncharacterized membrane protein required for colicin V production
MPLIEAALAFAITMLALSLVVSSFVEMIHRILSMREAGLKYMLGQMFDQVLAKYVVAPALQQAKDAKLPEGARKAAEKVVIDTRDAFVERMSANRAPMGATPKATPTNPVENIGDNKKSRIHLWNGRELAAMTPGEFMERLGSIDIGAAVKQANTAASDAAKAAGAAAADAADVVLKDVAQKFEAFGKEASVYFEGRARLLSVVVAIGLAFTAHVDAVDLFRTYLRDPNARAKVIEQSEAVTAQHKAALEAAKAVRELSATAPEEIKKQIDLLKQDWQTAIANTNTTIKQYADLGVPIGWNDDRFKNAHIGNLVWLCPDKPVIDPQRPWLGKCKEGNIFVWFADPNVVAVWIYLFFGGLLIGLGAPFWYSAVTGLTNIRNTAKGTTGGDVHARAAVAAAEAGKAQPVTPVGVFHVSHAAQP